MFSLPKLYLQKLREIGLKGPCLSEESFINLPIDESNLKQVINAVKNHDIQNIKDVVLIGIGGSSLGTRAVYTALKKEKSLARIHFLDQINPGKVDEIAKSAKIWAARETAVVVISKSGTTLETIINHKLIQEKLPFYKECPLFFVTGEKTKNTPTENTLIIPNTVGGRFSVFSAVGLLPLALAGANILKLLSGAMKARKECLNSDEEQNPAIHSAKFIFANLQSGREILNLFTFSPELKDLAEWYRQLIGESLGKDRKGIFPTISEGSKDLHSLQQYFVGGKQNVQHEFMSVEGINRYQKTIMEATIKIYEEKKIPFRKKILKNLSEEELGAYMQEKMMEVLFLARLMELNPFGQPDVEGYKEKTKELLMDKDNPAAKDNPAGDCFLTDGAVFLRP